MCLENELYLDYSKLFEKEKKSEDRVPGSGFDLRVESGMGAQAVTNIVKIV